MAKASEDPQHYITLATGHLKRVRDAVMSPDWSDIGTYGLYCLEALVRAAALKDGQTPIRTHWGKQEQAKNLRHKYKLPNIEHLLSDLNQIRKASAYGDDEFDPDDFDAEQIYQEINEYHEKVSIICK